MVHGSGTCCAGGAQRLMGWCQVMPGDLCSISYFSISIFISLTKILFLSGFSCDLFPSTSPPGMFQFVCFFCPGRGTRLVVDHSRLSDWNRTHLQGLSFSSCFTVAVLVLSLCWHLSLKADVFSKNTVLLLWQRELPLPSVFKSRLLPLAWLQRRGWGMANPSAMDLWPRRRGYGNSQGERPHGHQSILCQSSSTLQRSVLKLLAADVCSVRAFFPMYLKATNKLWSLCFWYCKESTFSQETTWSLRNPQPLWQRVREALVVSAL